MSATLPAVYSFPPAASCTATSETPDPAGAVASTTVPVPPPLRTRCGWCRELIVDGELGANGLESTGICDPCYVRQMVQHAAGVARRKAER